MGVLLPSPQVTHSPGFRRASELASKTKTSNRLNGFVHFPFQMRVRGYLSLNPTAGVQRGGAVSPRSQSQPWGQANRHSFLSPPPVLSRSHFPCWNVSQAGPSLLSLGHTRLHF